MRNSDDLFQEEDEMLESVTLRVYGVGQQIGTTILFLCRDPENWNAVHPVITALLKRGNVFPCVAASDWTLAHLECHPDVFGKKYPLHALDPDRKLEPGVLVTASSGSCPFLEILARKAWPRVPMLCIESGYEACSGLFSEMQRAGVGLPEFVCCIDGLSLQRLEEFDPRFGNLARAMTTGNPDFTRVAAEGVEKREAARKIMELGERRLVTYLGVPGDEGFVAAFAEALKELPDKNGVLFALRRHPSDPADYTQSFRTHGLCCLEDAGIDMETIIAASNLVLSPGSPGIVHAALRRIPAAHVIDRRYFALNGSVRFPLPLVQKGAAVYCRDVERAGEFVRHCLVDQEPGADVDLVVMRRAQRDFRDSHRNGKPAEEIARHILGLAAR